MREKGHDKPSRSCGERSSREGAVFVRSTGPLPYGRGSERGVWDSVLETVNEASQNLRTSNLPPRWHPSEARPGGAPPTGHTPLRRRGSDDEIIFLATSQRRDLA